MTTKSYKETDPLFEVTDEVSKSAARFSSTIYSKTYGLKVGILDQAILLTS